MDTSMQQRIENSYDVASEVFAEWGIDTQQAMQHLSGVSLSIHCWQGDDVSGFEGGQLQGGGILATGNHPGRARNADELRSDLEMALRMIPGRHRVNLHAIYAETGGRKVDRDALSEEHFARWAAWASEHRLGLDFNPSFFSHPKAADGLTLTHPDDAIRNFWIEHGKASRRIAAYLGRRCGTPAVNNVWIPDGAKDTPADRKTPRLRLQSSLDELFSQPLSEEEIRDSVESKLFGLGSESYVVGSHEFYMGYVMTRRKMLCLDAGHFHPTESIADKISSILSYSPELLLHISRGVRWDSDHVPIHGDELHAIARQLIWGEYLSRVHLALDYFDATINRVAAWVVGARNVLQALLAAMLTPIVQLRELEERGDLAGRLALMEQCQMLPWPAVWDYWCQRQGVPAGIDWLSQVRAYERQCLHQREGRAVVAVPENSGLSVPLPAQLIDVSRRYGVDAALALAGGGNTSVKQGNRMLVKASGFSLARADDASFVEMDLDRLHKLIHTDFPEDTAARETLFKQRLLTARVDPHDTRRPSVEAVLHSLLPSRFVVHLHPTLVNAITCCVKGRQIADKLFSDRAVWIGDVEPGLLLAREVARQLIQWQSAHDSTPPGIVLLKNHGLVVSGQTLREVDARLGEVLERVRARLAPHQDQTAFGDGRPYPSDTRQKLATIIARNLQQEIGGEIQHDQSASMLALVSSESGCQTALAGPLTPDQIVYCRSFPLWIEALSDVDAASLSDQVHRALAIYRASHGTDPIIVLVSRVGGFAIDADARSAATAMQIYRDAIQIMADAQRLGGVSYVPDPLRRFIETWEVEAYRRSISRLGDAVHPKP